jgi:heme-degrading monooxygenase HmoA
VSLVAKPFSREFATLSAWRDRDSLNAMVRTEPHRTVMGRYHAVMDDAKFVFYTPESYPPTWQEADRELA